MRIIGVPPMASRTFAQIFCTNQVYTARRLTAETAELAEKTFLGVLHALRGKTWTPDSNAKLAKAAKKRFAITLPKLISAPAVVAAPGTKPKRIEEYAGRVNSGHAQVSVARMTSPSGWQEPGQRPEFEEITVVLRGLLRVEHHDGVLDVQAGQAVVTAPGEWVRYSTPGADGAEYVAVCLPAFSPATVHRDE
jgi:quercetin dioxygenase-like cupin family protein